MKLLHTNYKGRKMSFVISAIAVIVEDVKDTDQCLIWVVGSETPCTCSESYDLILRKIEVAGGE